MTVAGPSPFPTKRLKFLAPLRRSTADGNHERPYVGLEDIAPWTGHFTGDVPAPSASASLQTPASPPGASSRSLSNMFESGDVLFGKLRPYLAKAWVAQFSGRSTTEFLIMRPVDAEPRFLRYVCLSRPFVEAVDSATVGSKMPRAEWDHVGTLRVPVPKPGLQEAIADYLDRETARIDALIATKERVLALLAERRGALITRAVTRGLDAEASLQNFGAPWLEEVPAHWRLTRLKFVARIQAGLALGERYAAQVVTEYPYLRVANVQDGFLDLSEVRTVSIPESTAAAYRLRAGDVLMNEGGDADKLGRGVIWRDEIAPCLHQNHVFAVRPRGVSSAWLALWIAGDHARAYLESRSKQSTNLASISATNLMEMPLLQPPEVDQSAIVSAVQRSTRSIDAAHSATKRTVDLLKERRVTLISAAVTGQIEVEAAS